MIVRPHANQDLRRVGWDPGFSSSKMGEVRREQVATRVVCSTVGLCERMEESSISLGGILRVGQGSRRPERVAWPGEGGCLYAAGGTSGRAAFQRGHRAARRAVCGPAKVTGGGAHRVAPVVALLGSIGSGWTEKKQR